MQLWAGDPGCSAFGPETSCIYGEAKCLQGACGCQFGASTTLMSSVSFILKTAWFVTSEELVSERDLVGNCESLTGLMGIMHDAKDTASSHCHLLGSI